MKTMRVGKNLNIQLDMSSTLNSLGMYEDIERKINEINAAKQAALQGKVNFKIDS